MNSHSLRNFVQTAHTIASVANRMCLPTAATFDTASTVTALQPTMSTNLSSTPTSLAEAPLQARQAFAPPPSNVDASPWGPGPDQPVPVVSVSSTEVEHHLGEL
jgi:hypothetical protein